MNEWDIAEALVRHKRHPVKHRAARILDRLRNLTNEVSDGWCYWPRPARSAAKLMAVVEDLEDPTEKDLAKALVPVKAMLTRNAEAFSGKTLCLD